MHEVLDQLLGYARGVWRFRWLALGISWFVCLTGWFVVMKLPDQYQASTKIYVDTDTVLRPILQGLAIQTNVQQQVELMTKTLLSRPNLEKLARMTDLDLRATTPEQLEQLVARLRGKIVLTRESRNQNFYLISYSDRDAQVARKVVQSLLTIFVESSLGEGRKDRDTAQQFVDEQLKEYEAQLLEAESRLKDFKRENVGMMPGEGGTYYERLQNTMTALEEARLQYSEARNRRDELRRQLENFGDEPTGSLLPSAPATPTSTIVDARIQALEAKLDDLLLRYTEHHPEVVSVKGTIADLKRQKTEQLALISANTPKTAAGEPRMSSNPVYQQIKISLAETEANVATTSVRVREFESRVRSLKQKIDTVPAIEAELTALNRDYEVYKGNYNELLGRREASRLAQKAEASGDDVAFKVIEPPVLPLQPAGPNRPLFMLVVLLGALAAGVGFAVFIVILRPAFYDQRSIIAVTGFPVLGEVSLIRDRAHATRRLAELGSYVAALVMLLMVLAAMIVFEKSVMALLAGLPEL